MAHFLARRSRMTLLAALVLLARAPAAQGPPPAGALFDPGVVHRVDLSVNSRDWMRLQLHYLDNDYYPATLAIDGTVIRGVAVRSRGEGSRSSTKPGIRIDIDRYEPGRRVFGLRGLVLDNHWQDPSMMRERLAMAMLLELGEPASREAPARVYVNAAYLGLYSIVEEIEPPFLERWFDDLDGYLYEYRWFFPWGFEWLGDDLDRYASMFEPKNHQGEHAARLWGPVREIVRAYNEVPDAEFEEIVGAQLALDALAVRVAHDVAQANIDGMVGGWGLSNVFLYRPSAGAPARFLPWDLDTAFADPAFSIVVPRTDSLLFNRLMTAPAPRQRYFEALSAAADLMGRVDAPADEGSVARGWLEERIEEQYERTREAVRQDPRRPFRMEEFEADVETLREFARRRPAFLRSEIARAAAGSSASAAGRSD